MDGRDALPRLASNGGQRLDKVPLGRNGERAETEILLAQEGRQARVGRTARAVDESPLGPDRPLGRELCLTLNNQLRNGVGRKSTRLNSSHRCISYAVFCLK